MARRFGYSRVSTSDQDWSLQLEALTKAGVDDRGRARPCNLRVRSPMLYPLSYAAPARRRTTPDEAPVWNSIPACSSGLRIARACVTVIGGSPSRLSARANVSGRSLQARARSFRSQPSRVRAARICEPVITIPNPCPCLTGCDLLARGAALPLKSRVVECFGGRRSPHRRVRSSSHNRSP